MVTAPRFRFNCCPCGRSNANRVTGVDCGGLSLHTTVAAMATQSAHRRRPAKRRARQARMSDLSNVRQRLRLAEKETCGGDIAMRSFLLLRKQP